MKSLSMVNDKWDIDKILISLFIFLSCSYNQYQSFSGSRRLSGPPLPAAACVCPQQVVRKAMTWWWLVGMHFVAAKLIACVQFGNLCRTNALGKEKLPAIYELHHTLKKTKQNKTNHPSCAVVGGGLSWFHKLSPNTEVMGVEEETKQNVLNVPSGCPRCWQTSSLVVLFFDSFFFLLYIIAQYCCFI